MPRGKTYDPSRLDGPEDRKRDLDRRYDPKGGGTNPFQWKPSTASLKIKKKKKKRRA